MLRSLNRPHSDLAERFAAAIAILGADPYNRSREHAIRKLESIRQEEGQHRLRFGRRRFRYDIYNRDAVLHYCGWRREDTHRWRQEDNHGAQRQRLCIHRRCLWGATVFLTGMTNLLRPGYGSLFLKMMASLYPGYDGVALFTSVTIGALYAISTALSHVSSLRGFIRRM